MVKHIKKKPRYMLVKKIEGLYPMEYPFYD